MSLMETELSARDWVRARRVRHPEPRVRHEAVSALAKVDAGLARPLLLRMMESTDSRMFTAVLHQLGRERDPATARMLLTIMLVSPDGLAGIIARTRERLRNRSGTNSTSTVATGTNDSHN